MGGFLFEVLNGTKKSAEIRLAPFPHPLTSPLLPIPPPPHKSPTHTPIIHPSPTRLTPCASHFTPHALCFAPHIILCMGQNFQSSPILRKGAKNRGREDQDATPTYMDFPRQRVVHGYPSRALIWAREDPHSQDSASLRLKTLRGVSMNPPSFKNNTVKSGGQINRLSFLPFIDFSAF